MDLGPRTTEIIGAPAPVIGRYDHRPEATHNLAACVECGALVSSTYRTQHDEFYARLGAMS